SGDMLDTIRADIPVQEIGQFFSEAYNESKPRDWLDKATARFIYSFGERIENNGKVTYGHHPAGACAIVREQHVVAGGNTKIQVAIEYSDGSGNVLVKKSLAEADPALNNSLPRFIASGKRVDNNKGKPVKQFEPYFSDNEHRFDKTEAERDVGVTPVMFYDA